jgi:hypothetical protein
MQYNKDILDAFNEMLLAEARLDTERARRFVLRHINDLSPKEIADTLGGDATEENAVEYLKKFINDVSWQKIIRLVNMLNDEVGEEFGDMIHNAFNKGGLKSAPNDPIKPREDTLDLIKAAKKHPDWEYVPPSKKYPNQFSLIWRGEGANARNNRIKLEIIDFKTGPSFKIEDNLHGPAPLLLQRAFDKLGVVSYFKASSAAGEEIVTGSYPGENTEEDRKKIARLRKYFANVPEGEELLAHMKEVWEE